MKKQILTSTALLLTSVMLLTLAVGCAQGGKPGAASGTSHSEQAVSSEADKPNPSPAVRGVDVSSLIANEQSGVVYRNEQGEAQDIFLTLSQADVNYIRVRVWNDPYDAEGHGYGGGNCDAAKAAEIGRRAAQYGMKLLVDFHYSDFWADPSAQLVPKAWTNLSFAQKKQALGAYTIDSLHRMLDAGADVGMVQVGNEINHGMAGETDIDRVMELLSAAVDAVHDVAAERHMDILTAVHYTDVQQEGSMAYYAQTLQVAGVAYDVFGVSYYPYWHGSLAHLQDVLSDITQTYGKQTAVLETAYPYTLADGDGYPNIIGSADALCRDYAADVDGQSAYLRDVKQAAAACDAWGVFYWEGAWIPVGDRYESHAALWEQYGSGWASRYAAAYCDASADSYDGGCSWENQALFDFTGRPLPSLKAFGAA